MEIIEKYVVYRLNPILNSTNHLSLEKVQFKGWVANSFDTELDAIKALINDDRTYEDYVILKQVNVR